MQDLPENRGERLQSWLSPKRLGEDPVPAFLLQNRPHYRTALRQLRVDVFHSSLGSAKRPARLENAASRLDVTGAGNQDPHDRKVEAGRQTVELPAGLSRPAGGADRGDKLWTGRDAGCLDPPQLLSETHALEVTTIRRHTEGISQGGGWHDPSTQLRFGIDGRPDGFDHPRPG